MLFKRTGLSLVDKKKSWRSTSLHSNYSQQSCVTDVKASKRLDLHCSHHEKRNDHCAK